MDNNQKLRIQVREEFSDYLDVRKYRKTKERFAILDHIYTSADHFDMESLQESMNETSLRVSRATLYNTMDLLLDCGLVVKHQFGTNAAKYECAYGNENHDHIICTSCGKVWESDSGSLFTPAMRRKIKKFTIRYYSMYIYGTCSKCSFVKRQELYKLKREREKDQEMKSKSKSKSIK